MVFQKGLRHTNSALVLADFLLQNTQCITADLYDSCIPKSDCISENCVTQNSQGRTLTEQRRSEGW